MTFLSCGSEQKRLDFCGKESVGPGRNRNRKGSLNMSHSKTRTKTKPARVKAGAKRRPTKLATTKQDAAIALLRQRKGTTLAALVETTGWQPHSVRGFLSAVVRKKLGLTLLSEKIEG